LGSKPRCLPLQQAVAIALVAAASAFPQAAPWYQTDFPPDEFKARWEKVLDRIGSNAVAVLQGVSQTNGFIMPRQSNEFYYLCGIETPHSYLLLDGRQRKVTLFLPPRNPRLESAEGKVLSADDADLVMRLTGVNAVESTEAMRGDWLGRAQGQRTPGARQNLTIYTPFTPAEGSEQSRGELASANTAILNDSWDGRIPREMHFVGLLATRVPRTRIEDLSPILDEMRSVKSQREIALIRRASEIAGLGLIEAMRSTKSGIFEYELDAAARYIFLVNGARLEGYRSITAAGTANIWNMHYYRNMSRLDDGQLVLMDFGPDYHYYTSDITRMWPVNGVYSPWQRELLQFVLIYRNAILARIRPGVTARQFMEEAKGAMEPVFARTTFSKPAYEQAARQLVNQGGGVFSHPVGMAVHDDGEYVSGPLKPGHVFSIDPQLRVPEENLYVRYEDVVAVTEQGVENFTAFLPSELDDIEKVVRQGGGIVRQFPPKAAPRF
jgi:Xaa-Pro aminopeptidase